MKWLKSFKKHKESLVIDLQFQSIDLMESLNIWHDVLLNAINAEELDIFDTLELPEDIKGLDLNILSDNAEFINSLTKKALRKSQLEDTDTLATFVNKPCKFMFIYAQPNDDKEKEGGENLIYLENPVYIIFQNKNDGAVRLYKVNSDVNNFYNKLSSKTIEVVDGAENYIYTTINGGAEWELQNSDKVNDTYKKVFRKEDLQKVLDDKDIKINFI
jgi:hypothetical protein